LSCTVLPCVVLFCLVLLCPVVTVLQTKCTKGAFDLLKNEGHDRTTSVVQCLICKIVSGTGQTGGKGQDKTDIFVPHQTTAQLFVSRTSCLKYQNSISSSKNRIKQKLIQCYKNLSCIVLPCVVLFCLLLKIN